MITNHELEQVISFGYLEKDFEIAGFKVKMRTLTGDEIDNILKVSSGFDEVSKFATTEIMILARAIIAINDKKVEYIPTSEDDTITQSKVVEQNEKIIRSWQKTVIDIFYGKYSELQEEQQRFLAQSQTLSKKSGVVKSGKQDNVSDWVKS
jgi:hypothetical protein